MSELKSIERSVNCVVGKPIAWTVYGLWLTAKYCLRKAQQASIWLRARLTARRAAAQKV